MATPSALTGMVEMHAPSSLNAYDRSSVCAVRLLVAWLKGALQRGGRGLQEPTVVAAHNVLLNMLNAEVGSVQLVCVCAYVCACVCMRVLACLSDHSWYRRTETLIAALPLSSPLHPPILPSLSTWQTRAMSTWCCVWPSCLSAGVSTRQTWRPCWMV